MQDKKMNFYYIDENREPFALGKIIGIGDNGIGTVRKTDPDIYGLQLPIDETGRNELSVLSFRGGKMVSISTPYLFYTMDNPQPIPEEKTGLVGGRRRKTNRKKSKRRKTKRRKSNRRR
jgi:hypothetical protein